MDDILASIRRIIDAGESKARQFDETQAAAKAPVEPSVTVPPAAANDAGGNRTPPVTGLTQKPSTPKLETTVPAAPAVNAPALTMKTPVADPAVKPEPPVQPVSPQLASPAAMPATLEAEPDISEVEAALEAEFAAMDREILRTEKKSKYEERFTEADSGAFDQLGDILRGSLNADTGKKPMPNAVSLVSDSVSRNVANSLSSLSGHFEQSGGRNLDLLAEDMLRPMLQDWLDNNLPSLVERLVRSEIERIARGEPHLR